MWYGMRGVGICRYIWQILFTPPILVQPPLHLNTTTTLHSLTNPIHHPPQVRAERGDKWEPAWFKEVKSGFTIVEGEPEESEFPWYEWRGRDMTPLPAPAKGGDGDAGAGAGEGEEEDDGDDETFSMVNLGQ